MTEHNVEYLRPKKEQRGGGNGGDNDHEARIRALENGLIELNTHMGYLATKEDITKVKNWVLLGVITGLFAGIPAAVAVLMVFIRFFPS